MNNFITFCDFEATDKNPATAEILTGFFETWKGDEKIDELYVELRPERYIDASYKIHKISKEDAMNFPDKILGLRKIFSYLMKYPGTFVCHANELVFGVHGYYDWQLLRGNCPDLHWFYKTFKDYKIESTHTNAKKHLQLDNYSLDSVCRFFNIELDHHNCKSDAIACRKIWFLLQNYKTTLFDFMEG